MNIVLTEEVISTNTEPTILRDSKLKGFGVRIYPSGKISYFIEPTINGKSKRKVIGKYPDLSVAEAREVGKSRINELATVHILTTTIISYLQTQGFKQSKIARLRCYHGQRGGRLDSQHHCTKAAVSASRCDAASYRSGRR